MNRITHCSACNMIRNGVKSRIALTHTCGLERGAVPIGGGLYEKWEELKAAKKPKPKPKPKH